MEGLLRYWKHPRAIEACLQILYLYTKEEVKPLPKRYRPISLTSHLIKIFERVIRKHIVKYLETNNLLNQGQHRFRSGRSCLTQLIDHYDRVLHQCETGANVDVIYLDFAKAFDKVNHNILLSKIRNMGTGGKVGIWLYAFLKNRYQVIVTKKSMSEKSNVIFGVPWPYAFSNHDIRY